MDYSLHRAVRFDADSGVLDKLKVLLSSTVEQAVLYYELGSTTLKPHYQGWIKFKGEEQEAAWEGKEGIYAKFKLSIWPPQKGCGRGKNNHSYCKPFKKGETAQVYSSKDKDLSYSQNVSEDELKRLCDKSYQKGATRKQTFLNAIVKRMQDKAVKTRSQVYYELCEYYCENDKELNPWRLTPQCNTVCWMLWGKKFSQFLSETEVRIEFNAPQEEVNDSPPASEDIQEEDNGTSASDDGEEQPCVHQEAVSAVDDRSDSGDRLAGVSAAVFSESASVVFGAGGCVRQLQDSRCEADVHSVLGQQRSECAADCCDDGVAPCIHVGGSQRVPRRVSSDRGSVSGVGEGATDQEATGAVQYLHQESRSGAGGGAKGITVHSKRSSYV